MTDSEFGELHTIASKKPLDIMESMTKEIVADDMTHRRPMAKKFAKRRDIVRSTIGCQFQATDKEHKSIAQALKGNSSSSCHRLTVY